MSWQPPKPPGYDCIHNPISSLIGDSYNEITSIEKWDWITVKVMACNTLEDLQKLRPEVKNGKYYIYGIRIRYSAAIDHFRKLCA